MTKLEGKIFLTGGSGFLGRGILRRIEREGWPAKVTIYSRDEDKQVRAKERYGDLVTCVLGDVRDMQHMVDHMWGHDVVIHAAAVKFIPEAEDNVWETCKVNLDGSRNVARAASKAHVPRVVGISTDKACMPVNIYGMTKAAMERVFAECNRWGTRARFATVRYGNVVGSTGSIVPLFQRQLEEKGRVTVTSREATRFWISVDEAVDLILYALENMGQFPGAVFANRCGAMNIDALARLIAGEAEVEYIGMRPGEKQHETLIHHQESQRVLQRGGYFICNPSTSRHTEPGEPWTYASYSPARMISPVEMAEMIKDAEGV